MARIARIITSVIVALVAIICICGIESRNQTLTFYTAFVGVIAMVFTAAFLFFYDWR